MKDHTDEEQILNSDVEQTIYLHSFSRFFFFFLSARAKESNSVGKSLRITTATRFGDSSRKDLRKLAHLAKRRATAEQPFTLNSRRQCAYAVSLVTLSKLVNWILSPPSSAQSPPFVFSPFSGRPPRLLLAASRLPEGRSGFRVPAKARNERRALIEKILSL